MKQMLHQTTVEEDLVYAEPLTEECCSEIDSIPCLPTIELRSTDELRVEPLDVVHLGQDDSLPFGTAMAFANEVANSSTKDMEQLEGFSTRYVAPSNHDVRAEFTSTAFYRTSTNAPFGLHFHRETTMIASIDEGSVASASRLKVGDNIFSVNNKAMKSESIYELLDIIVGSVTVVVHNKGGSSNIVESSIMKSDPKQRCGLGLRRGPQDKLYVSSIYSDKVFVDSLLNIGDQVIAINDVHCDGLGAEEAADIIRQSPKHVTVLAKTRCETGAVVAELSSRTMRLSIGNSHALKLAVEGLETVREGTEESSERSTQSTTSSSSAMWWLRQTLKHRQGNRKQRASGFRIVKLFHQVYRLGGMTRKQQH